MAEVVKQHKKKDKSSSNEASNGSDYLIKPESTTPKLDTSK